MPSARKAPCGTGPETAAPPRGRPRPRRGSRPGTRDGLAGAGERIAGGMAAHRLCRGRARGPGAVVDQKRAPPPPREPRRDLTGERGARRADLGDRAGGRVARRDLSQGRRPSSSAKTGRRSSASAMRRSTQPRALRTSWWTGTRRGTRRRPGARGPGTDRTPRATRRRALQPEGLQPAQPDAALDQVDRERRAKPSTRALARKRSAIRVPRPGPSSTRRTGAGRPSSDQAWPSQRPTISPNIWLTSGAVTKSPATPSGSALVVAERRVAERQLHEAGDRERAAGADLVGQDRLKIAQGSRVARRGSSRPPARGRP